MPCASVQCVRMAAQLGLVGHEANAAACSYPPPAAAASYFFPPELVADSGGAVMELAPPMADYCRPGIMGARTPDYYCLPTAALPLPRMR